MTDIEIWAPELVKDLNERIEKARNAYYLLASPVLSDAEFDALEARLKGLIAQYPQYAYLATSLTTVGSDVTGSGARIKHVRPMLSIENQYTKEDVVKWFIKIQEAAHD